MLTNSIKLYIIEAVQNIGGRMPTIDEVAKKAGVSLGTVSNVLNNPDKVKVETRERVLKVIRELDFIPNMNARNLSRLRTDTITLIYPFSKRPRKEHYYSDLLAGIIETCFTMNFKLVLSSLPETISLEENLSAYARLVDSGAVDGVILTRPAVDDPVIQLLTAKKQNFVVFGRSNLSMDFSWVDIDGELGIKQAVKYLLKLNHRKIAYIGTSEEYVFSHHRLEGYKKGLLEEGFPIDSDLIIHTFENDDEIETGSSKMIELLQLPDPPKAVIVAGSQLAIGAVKGIEKFGYEVGKDISVICFDDADWSLHYNPPITAIRQPLYDAGKMIARMLIECILDKPSDKSQILLEPELIIRESCCKIE